jgi:hypothetical protein
MMTPLITFLMMVWVPKPTPMASAPPMKAKAVSGMRARLRTMMTRTNETAIMIQRRITLAACSLTRKRLIIRPSSRRASQASSQ